MTDELKQWEYDKGYTKGYSDGRASLIEELEKVKAEVTDWYMAKFNTSENVIDIIDRHINELKSEQADKNNNFRERLRLSELEGNFLDTGITQGIV